MPRRAVLGLALVAIFFLIGPSVLPAAWAAQGPINGTNPGSTNNCTGSFFNNCGGTPTFNFPYFVIVIIIVIIGGVWAILTISRRA